LVTYAFTSCHVSMECNAVRLHRKKTPKYACLQFFSIAHLLNIIIFQIYVTKYQSQESNRPHKLFGHSLWLYISNTCLNLNELKKY
jgi:hypothetical protein